MWLTQSARVGLLWLVIGVVLALVRRRPELLVPLVAADLLADAASGVLKTIVDRPRPPVRYPLPRPLIGTPHDGSFPSGHASTSFACATVLAAYAPRLAPLWILLACAVAFSRVYVGVHYPLDVIGGAVLGTLVGVGTLWAFRALRRRGAGLPRLRRSPRSG